MQSIAAFSFVLHDRHGADRLARFFYSLAAQRLPTCRLEICFVDTGRDPEPLRLVRRHRERMEPFSLNVIPARDVGPAEAWNLGLARCSGLLAACVRPGLRLDPAFTTALLGVLRAHPEVDVLSTDFVHGGPLGRGMIRPHGAPVERLRRVDALGPLPALTRRARRMLAFREGSPFPTWELGIRAAQMGLRFLRLHRPLYAAPAELWMPDRGPEALARLVVRQPGFFHADQVRWALGVLRRKSWAVPAAIRHLPAPREIRALMEARVRRDHPAGLTRPPRDVLPGPLRPLGLAGAVGA